MVMGLLPTEEQIEASRARIREAIEARGEDVTLKRIAEESGLKLTQVHTFLYGNGSMGLTALAELERGLIRLGLLHLGNGGKR